MSALTVARLEWRRLFLTPFAWIVLAFVLGLLAWDFLSRLDAWMVAQDREALAGATVTHRLLMPVLAQAAQLVIALTAILSLRAFSLDRRLGTDVLLLGAPLGRFAVMAGKHAGLWILPAIAVLVPLLMSATLAGATDPDWGRLSAATLGLLCLALGAAAIALALSAATMQPALGAVLTLAVLMGLWLADYAPLSRGILDSPLSSIGLGARLRPFLAGLVSSAGLVYFAALTIAGIALAANAARPAHRRHRWLAGLAIVTVALLAVVAGDRFDSRWDWTQNRDNSLSDPTRRLLDSLDGPLQVNVFASTDRRLRQSIDRFFAPYRQHLPGLAIRFLDPAADPDLVRRHDLRLDGEVDLIVGERHERLRQLSETDVALALQRLTRPADHLVAYTWGSGERDLRGVSPFDLGRFGEALETRGIRTLKLDLLLNPVIPGNLDLLIVTQPRQALLPGVVASMVDYLARGGNLLWLSDPGGLTGLDPLAAALDLRPLPGVVVDARAESMGIDNPRFAVVVDFPDHPVTRDFRNPTVLPQSVAWEAAGDGPWDRVTVLASHASTWTETGAIEGQVGFDEGTVERAGPLSLGLALTRARQRVAVIGDADFLSNQYVGIAGNLDFGLRLVNWLVADDEMIEIPARLSRDGRLDLSRRQMGWVGLGWLVLVPLGCLGIAGLIAWRRRRA